MSSLGSPDVGGEGTSGKRGPGRPKGSRNRKTLAALATAAAAAPTTAAATGAALALDGEDAPKKRGPGRPKGERGKGDTGGGRSSFAASPPWAASGQQEQENPCCSRGRCLRARESPHGGLFIGRSFSALAGAPGAPAAGLHLG
jgi:hypothetical protein